VGAFTGYFDASGTENDDAVLTVAGVISDTEAWDQFDREWLALLDSEGLGQAFRMHDFAHMKKAFASGWRDNEARRSALIVSLAELAAHTVHKAFVRSILLVDFRAVNDRYEAKETWGGPYALAQANCVLAAMEWLMTEKLPENPYTGVAFFVERGDVGQDAFMRLMRTKLSPEMADSVTLLAKKNNLGQEISPFHAADVLAYEVHRHHVGVNAGALPSAMRGALKTMKQHLHPKVGLITEDEIEQLCIATGTPRRKH